MGDRPGTSWVISGDGKRKVVVDLKRFGVSSPLPSVEAISIVFNALEAPVRTADLGPLTIGKIISNQAQSEAGMYIDLAFTEGAAIRARCPRLTEEVELTVAKSSKALRSAVWAALAVSVVGGLWFTGTVFTEWDPKLRLAIGLLLGAFVAVGVMFVLMRSQALTTGRSEELADELAAIVESALPQEASAAKPSAAKPRKRRNKRKKRRAVPEDDEA